jgi:hypothetical protein
MGESGGKYKWRKGEYVEGSTKGKSLMMARSWKGDSCVQVWMDSRMLAKIGMWMEREGIRLRFMSELVRVPLEMLVERLEEEGKVEEIETSDARFWIESRFRIDLNPRGRGKKNLLNNMQLSEVKKEEVESDGDEVDFSKWGPEGPPIGSRERMKWIAALTSKSLEVSKKVNKDEGYKVERKEISAEKLAEQKREVEEFNRRRMEYAEKVKKEQLEKELAEKERVKGLRKASRIEEKINALKEKKKKIEEVIRPKSSEEMDAEEERIKRKDEEYLRQLNECPRPDGLVEDRDD